MKPHLVIFLFCIVAQFTSGILAEEAPQIPPQLTTLKTRYRSDLQAAREPLRTRYVTALDALLRSTSKGGDLDAAVAVKQELDAAKGKSGTVTGGKVTAELTTLKSSYEASVQAASESIQSRYITALGTLQDNFTKSGNLPAALAVRQEISATKPQTSSGTANVPSQIPEAIVQTNDLIQPRSVWIGDPNNILTITERQGENFRAKFLVGSNIIREVKGTIKDNKLTWYAKDVRAVQGGQGGDNFGTVNGDKIDFVWRSDNGANGTFALKQKKPN